MLSSFAFQLGSFVIYVSVLAGAVWTGARISRWSGRPWIGVVAFAALFFGIGLLLALGGLPAPAGYANDD
ncbi:hypothetical protein [Burkholderia multivorans]|uniref:hypothetical protein n=1 Tax=Burkholderia multivorans TaxID=87883 RepID=UPI0004F5F192|nr:hypothetical protein [Burkholderia multivorans]AIO75994.1 putative membrane protein [Burkholderia multivorans]